MKHQISKKYFHLSKYFVNTAEWSYFDLVLLIKNGKSDLKNAREIFHVDFTKLMNEIFILKRVYHFSSKNIRELVAWTSVIEQWNKCSNEKMLLYILLTHTKTENNIQSTFGDIKTTIKKILTFLHKITRGITLRNSLKSTLYNHNAYYALGR